MGKRKYTDKQLVEEWNKIASEFQEYRKVQHKTDKPISNKRYKSIKDKIDKHNRMMKIAKPLSSLDKTMRVPKYIVGQSEYKKGGKVVQGKKWIVTGEEFKEAEKIYDDKNKFWNEVKNMLPDIDKKLIEKDSDIFNFKSKQKIVGRDEKGKQIRRLRTIEEEVEAKKNSLYYSIEKLFGHLMTKEELEKFKEAIKNMEDKEFIYKMISDERLSPSNIYKPFEVSLYESDIAKVEDVYNAITGDHLDEWYKYIEDYEEKEDTFKLTELKENIYEENERYYKRYIPSYSNYLKKFKKDNPNQKALSFNEYQVRIKNDKKFIYSITKDEMQSEHKRKLDYETKIKKDDFKFDSGEDDYIDIDSDEWEDF